MMSSTSVINVLSDLSFKQWLRILKKLFKTVFADRIRRRHTVSFILHYNSFLEPTKFLPLSDKIEQTAPLLPINLWSVKMKKLASKELVTSICTIWLEKRRTVEESSINTLNISTPQYVNRASRVHPSCGRSAIFCYPIFSRNLRYITQIM